MNTGTVYFYSVGGKLVGKKMYGSIYHRRDIIARFSKDADHGQYYHISPDRQVIKHRAKEPEPVKQPLIRPPAIYTNIKSNYFAQ
jgi:hypothetical protein